MGSVSRSGIGTPIAIAGAYHEAHAELLDEFGINVTDLGSDIEFPAALKMTRSMVTKGLLSLFIEAMLVAEEYEITDELLDSLTASFEDISFGQLGPTYLENSRASRRSGEMHEVIKTANELGLHAPIAEQTLRILKLLDTEGLSDEEYVVILRELKPYFFDGS